MGRPPAEVCGRPLDGTPFVRSGLAGLPTGGRGSAHSTPDVAGMTAAQPERMGQAPAPDHEPGLSSERGVGAAPVPHELAGAAAVVVTTPVVVVVASGHR